jgi:hypothetical protein
MIISWDVPYKQKCLSFIWGSEWEKGDFKFFRFRKVPLGWSFNIHRLSVSYDNYGKVRSSRWDNGR